MRLQRFRAVVLAAATSFCLGCPPAATMPTDDGGGAGGDAAATVTYTKDVQPIFKAKCSPCHAGMKTANHDIANNYADVNKPVESFDFDVCWKDLEQTMPKTVGECALLLINSGRMPMEAGCGSATPLKPEVCLTDAQKATVAAWVAAGMPQ